MLYNPVSQTYFWNTMIRLDYSYSSFNNMGHYGHDKNHPNSDFQKGIFIQGSSGTHFDRVQFEIETFSPRKSVMKEKCSVSG